MRNLIDLIVVGAGPAGLMAAKTAAEMGLKVAIIEKKRDIKLVRRACCAQFVLDDGYENEYIKIMDRKILFTKNGFDVTYTGRKKDIINNYHFSPSGHKIHFAHQDGRPFAVKFDKAQLLEDLWKECEKLGVELMLNTLAYDGEDLENYVRVDVKTDGKRSCIEARKLVIAEGANANLTGKFGFNRGRKLLGIPFVLIYTIEGTSGFEPNSWNQYYGRVYHPSAEIIIGSTLEDSDAVEMTIVGNKQFLPETFFDNIVKNSPLRENFAYARVVDKQGCSLRSYASLKKPYSGNVIIIGDSAAHVEVIVQGALMCGYHAAHAVRDEILGRNGFEQYTEWWNKSFEFNRMEFSDFITLYRSLSMMPQYTDDEIDYMFYLLEGRVLCGDFSQFKVPKTVWSEILSYKNQIQREKPLLFEKIKKIEQLNLAG